MRFEIGDIPDKLKLAKNRSLRASAHTGVIETVAAEQLRILSAELAIPFDSADFPVI